MWEAVNRPQVAHDGGSIPAPVHLKAQIPGFRVSSSTQKRSHRWPSSAPSAKNRPELANWAETLDRLKELEREMSSGVPYYERDLLNVLRQAFHFQLHTALSIRQRIRCLQLRWHDKLLPIVAKRRRWK